MRSPMYTANPENMRRTSGCRGASASSTNACGGFCFKWAGRAMASTATIADLPNAEAGEVRSLCRSRSVCKILTAFCEGCQSTNPTVSVGGSRGLQASENAGSQSWPSGPDSVRQLLQRRHGIAHNVAIRNRSSATYPQSSTSKQLYIECDLNQPINHLLLSTQTLLIT